MKVSKISRQGQAPSIWLFWTLLVVVGTLLVLFNVVYLPDLIARGMGYTGKLHLFAIDMTFAATPAQIDALLATYGSRGRTAYAAMMGLFDFVFPFLYGSFLSVGLRLVIGSTRMPVRLQRVIGAVPYIATAADWLENVCILIMLFSYPQFFVPIALIKNILTLIKFLVSAISLLGLLSGALYLLLRGIFSRFSGSARRGLPPGVRR
jgi:hypothetical protein